VTTTDEILALAASANPTTTVTEADVAAFRAAAARGGDSAVVRALLAVRSATAPAGRAAARPAAPSGPYLADAAWTAWLTTVAAMADGAVADGAVADGAAADGAVAAADGVALADEPEAAGGTAVDADERAAGTPRPVWCAVFGAAVSLTARPGSAPPPVPVTAAIAAGLSAAAIVASRLEDWGGWSSATVAAAIGAGVTAGLLLGLDEPRLRAAIGICATQAAGLRAAAGTDAFPLQVGKAAFNGVEAAGLARAGLTSPAEPLDGRRGLFALFGS